jgi:hypothetical protein
MSDQCKCAGIEQFIRSDTGNEFSGVCVVCTLCGRDFVLGDVSENPAWPAIKQMSNFLRKNLS